MGATVPPSTVNGPRRRNLESPYVLPSHQFSSIPRLSVRYGMVLTGLVRLKTAMYFSYYILTLLRRVLAARALLTNADERTSNTKPDRARPKENMKGILFCTPMPVCETIFWHRRVFRPVRTCNSPPQCC
jgi:hypothetical protein